MTKYAVRPKSSSGPLHSSLRTLDSLRLTFRIAPYRSQKFRATRPGARPAVLKPRQATRAAPEEPDDLAFYHRLHSYRDRGDAGHRLQGGPEDDENGDWADESTLIAMLQDGYAYTLISRATLLAGRVISLSDPLEDEDCDVTGLLDRLNDEMVAYRPGLKDRLKDILITTIHHQTRLHDALRDNIDTSFATGILSVDQVCKNVESLRLKDEDDVASFYSGVKVRAYVPGLGSSTSLFFP